jgi:hypothetical protein
VLTNEGARGVLDLCASRPGDWVTFAEACEYAGRSRAELRADLGALTRLLRRRFGKNNPGWEFKRDSDKEDFVWRLSPELAALWMDAASLDEAIPLQERASADRDEAAVEPDER